MEKPSFRYGVVLCWAILPMVLRVRKADTIQAARPRAGGSRSYAAFAFTIYLIAAPLGDFFKSV
jgi:hypothetical protein